VTKVYDLVCSAMSDEEFDDAVERLQVAGSVVVEEGLTDDDDDLLFNGNTAQSKSAVVFDRVRHEAYDYEAESQACEGVVRAILRLKRFGLDDADDGERAAVESACRELASATEESPAPPLCDDPRLLGDWELVATTSRSFAERKGLTGLGAAPFSKPVALFFRFLPSGEVVAKEVIEFFGQPVLLNELRGRFRFSADGICLQEEYTTADMGGQSNSPAFSVATATSRGLCITADGAVRLGRLTGPDGNSASADGYLVFKKLEDGRLERWLEERRLPVRGGTMAFMTQEQRRESYPYMK